MKLENILDETYHKAGKMDSECFSLKLDPVHTHLMNIIHAATFSNVLGRRKYKLEDRTIQANGARYNVFIAPTLIICSSA